jgi:uncharacterized protein
MRITYPDDPVKKRFIRLAEDYARQRMQNLRSSHGWDHVSRVVRIALRIAEAEGADSFVVLMASLLHDIARDEENASNGKTCHAEEGYRLTLEFLTASSMEHPVALHIAECVRTHRFRNNHSPESLEAKVLFDADKIDSIGAVGIGRAFLFSGEVGARLHTDEHTDILSTRAYTEEDTAYREFMVKLQYIRDSLYTNEGKVIAHQRHEFMTVFFNRLHLEVTGEA